MVHDPKGTVFNKYGVQSIPANVIISKQGKVTKVIEGADVKALEAAVAAAVR